MTVEELEKLLDDLILNVERSQNHECLPDYEIVYHEARAEVIRKEILTKFRGML